MTLLAPLGKTIGWLAALVVLLLCGPLLTLAFGSATMRGDWRTATHRSAGIAPDPAAHPEAIVQVYASRTFGWRGAFAVHTWVAAKPADADRYTRYEVIGWRAMRGGSALSVSQSEAPDAEWYGSAPVILADLRGAIAEKVAAKLPAAAQSYPYADRYSAWPGPNSNTFLAHLGREIPELGLNLPSIAIGKDYLPAGQVIARAPSGTGWQVSLGGIVGVTAASVEGFELNLFGLVAGVDFRRPALKFPGVGRIPGGL
ncbi:MAG: DUF3750 domain-containing protein [Betaproteobacteria bacterium]